MRDYTIAVIPGDGIGNEVVPEAVRVLDAAGDVTGSYRLRYEQFPWGCEYYLRHGEMMARDGLDILRPFDAILFGAVGFPTVPDHVSLRGLRLPICQGFEQYVCYRPSVLPPGVRSPLAGKKPGDVDFVVIRENTEGEYAGAGGRSHQGLPIEVAVQTAVFTRVGIERVVRYAFELARRRLRLPPEKMMVTIDRYGNTSAASVPLGLVDAVEEGRIQTGDHLVFVSFGAGLTWAAAVVHWEPQETAAVPVLDWPIRERLARPVEVAGTALWKARVSLSSKAEALLLPLYTYYAGYKKRRSKKH